MRVNLMKFNKKGWEQFKIFLDRARNGSTEDAPYHLLNDPNYSERLVLSKGEKVRINTHQNFLNRLDFADHLCSFLSNDEDLTKILDDTNSGSWLALAYFGQICKRKSDGTWGVGEDARYILDFQGRQKFYRHLICSIIAAYSLHRQKARLFLYTPPHKHSDTMEQVASREWVILNSELVEVLDTLYWDEGTSKPKVGAQSSGPVNDGALRRFVGRGSFTDQFRTTYDFWTMTAEQIMELLPSEFDSWKS